VANLGTLRGIGCGTLTIAVLNGTATTMLRVHNVLYVPDLAATLVSVGRLDAAGFTFKVGRGWAIVYSPSRAHIATLPHVGGFYHLGKPHAFDHARPVALFLRLHVPPPVPVPMHAPAPAVTTWHIGQEELAAFTANLLPLLSMVDDRGKPSTTPAAVTVFLKPLGSCVIFGTLPYFYQFAQSPLWRFRTYRMLRSCHCHQRHSTQQLRTAKHCSEDCLLERFHLQLSLHHA
jgi:hypothetical protein